MSIEATLKKQAKDILAKDNWAKSIVGFLCVLSVCGITLLVVDFTTLFMEDNILDKPVNIAIMTAIAMAGIVGFMLLSPFYTGYIKFIADSKNQKTGDVQSFIYYFDKTRYRDTLLLNLSLFVRYATLFILCALPVSACLVLMETMPQYETGFKIGALWTGIIGAVAFFMISRFYVMAQYLYVSNFDYIREKELIKASKYMITKNYGKVINLYISFIVYWILSFFMIPLVFVYPYFKHTAMLSYSYIYEMEKENPDSPYYKLNQSSLIQEYFNYDEEIKPQENNAYLDNQSEIQHNTVEDNECIQNENNTNAQISDENIGKNTSNFNNNQQTNQNAFIPDRNSDIIM